MHTEAFTHRSFYTQTLLHAEAFTHSGFYSQTLLHTESFTRRLFYTQRLLHTEAFTHRRFYTQKLLHTEALAHRSFDAQMLFHTEAFTHRSFDAQMLLHTDTFTHRSFDAQMLLHTPKLLHTAALTHRCFYTQKLLHTAALTHRRFHTQKLLHTAALTHRCFYTQKPLHTAALTHRCFYTHTHTHTLALFLSRPRSATTPKAHIKCLYAPNGYGRRACRRQLNMEVVDSHNWTRACQRNHKNPLVGLHQFHPLSPTTNHLWSSQITDDHSKQTQTNSACLCCIPNKIDKAWNITSWTNPSHKTRGILSDLLRLGEGAGSQAPRADFGSKGFPRIKRDFLEVGQSRKAKSVAKMPGF